jgi:hypothetical protein
MGFLVTVILYSMHNLVNSRLRVLIKKPDICEEHDDLEFSLMSTMVIYIA